MCSSADLRDPPPKQKELEDIPKIKETKRNPNFQKLWITILYTCNLYNTVHQLYFNLKKEIGKEKKMNFLKPQNFQELCEILKKV